MEAMRQTGNPPQGDLPFLTHDLIMEHLGEIGATDRFALLHMLTAHEQLPEHDPAKFILDVREGAQVGEVGEIRTGYRLGVFFGRSLVQRALGRSGVEDPDGRADLPLPPVVTTSEQKGLVTSYLHKASGKKLNKLTRRDRELSEDLSKAVELFCRKCEGIMPDAMLDGKDMVVRGVHDYLSVTALLLASTNQERHVSWRRALGLMTLGLGSFALSHAISNKKQS